VKIKKLLTVLGGLALLLCCLPAQSSAQQRPVTGVVYDSEKAPFVGVSVMVEGTRTVAITNAKGEFSINAAPGSVLVFSFIGFITERVTITNQSIVEVTMFEAAITVDAAVVTALGIKRDEKSLGYSVSTIKNEDFTNASSANWLSGLAGKVAGLNFDQAAAGPSGSVRVTLRGENSLDPTKSEALFVVDGVPINNSMTATGSAAYNSTSTDMPIDYGNGASDLNPDDIESVTVLKGASATALYGSRAANGAIIITTKGGKEQKGIGVTVSSTITFENASYWPDFQSEYGAGSSNNMTAEQVYSFYTVRDSNNNLIVSRSGQNVSWGPRFEGQLFYQYGSLQPDGSYIPFPWVARDWCKGFFETGVTYNNYVSVEGNNGRGTNARISVTDRRNEWITPNSGYTSQTVSFAASTPVNKFITLNARLNYLNKKSDNLPMSGYGRSTIPYLFMWMAPSIDINWMRDYKTWLQDNNDSTSNVFYTNGDSPYFQAYEQLNTMDRDRVYGTVDLNIKITERLNLVLRSGVDMSGEFRTWRKPWGSVNYLKGRYREQLIYQKEFNNDVLLKYDNTFGDFGFSGSLGGNLLFQGYNSAMMEAVQLESPGEYSLSNTVGQLIPTLNRRAKKVNSVYALFQFSWKDYLFLDVTGRNDWSSALQKGNNSYFYPSVSSSFLLSSFFKMNKKKVNMLKARISWANVGNDTDAYRIHNDYISSTFGGGVTVPTNYASPDIKPEMVRSWEFGIDGRFLNGLIGVDVAYYDATSYNQILNTPVDPAVGYYSTTINAGKITNKGWEVSLSTRPVWNKQFKWDISMVYSRNVNQVVELAPGVDTWIISSSGRAQVEARPGGTLGAIYGPGFQRVPEGTIIMENGIQKDISGAVLYEPTTGYPILENEYLLYLGETQNKWKGGITNTLNFKGFRFTFQFDGQFGGRAHSMTNSLFQSHGLLNNTLYGRYDGLIGDGYCLDPTTNTYYRNTTVTESISMYYDRSYNRDHIENNIFSTSFIKLREARIEYTLPSKFADKTILRGASVAVFGRNLAMWTKWPQYDPEIASLNGSDITRGFESGAFPMTRSWGVNLKLKF